MRRKRHWLIIAGLLLLGVLLPILYSVASYALATRQYEKLIAEKPVSQSDVEHLLFLYSARRISITNSSWGRNVPIASDDFTYQYNILWRDPIDVVYDSHGKVKHVFPSFE
jgi:hypothetical protein